MQNAPSVNELYDALFDQIHASLLSILVKEGILDLQSGIPDCIQEAFITYWKKQDQLSSHPNIKGWLFKAAIYHLKNRIAKYRFDKRYVIMSTDQVVGEKDTPVIDLIKAQSYDDPDDLIYWVKENISEESYDLLIDYYDKLIPATELAVKKGASVGALKMKVGRLVKKLRKISDSATMIALLFELISTLIS